MRNKLIFSVVFLCLALVSALLPTSALADFDKSSADRLEYALYGDSFQEWLDGEGASDWLVIAKYQRGAKADYSAYAKRLEASLKESKEGASSKQRMALTLLMLTGDTSAANTILPDTLGKQGVMSWAFGLHLINNGAVCPDFSAEAVVRQLLDLRLKDGGWAVRGENSDADVTAMVLQALAPYKDSYAKEIESAVDFLGKKQLPDGDYMSYGVSNPESGSQVIIALTSLGIDPLTDSRFMKDGKTLLDGIEKYFLSDGHVSHTYGGKANITATNQALCALVALERFYDGKDGLYIISNDKDNNNENSDIAESSDVSDEISSEAPSEAEPSAAESSIVPDISKETSAPTINDVITNRKAIAAVIVGILTLIVAAVMAIKKRRITDIIIVAVIGLAAIAGILFVNIESVDSHYSSVSGNKQAIGEVTISINCEAVNKELLPAVTVPIAEGDTVFDVLKYAAMKNNIAIAYTSSYGDVYVSAIGGISEFDYGSESGWMYTVNGVSPAVGASSYTLSDGDKIEWFYVTDILMTNP